jgi:hypothetical protein
LVPVNETKRINGLVKNSIEGRGIVLWLWRIDDDVKVAVGKM